MIATKKSCIRKSGPGMDTSTISRLRIWAWTKFIQVCVSGWTCGVPLLHKWGGASVSCRWKKVYWSSALVAGRAQWSGVANLGWRTVLADGMQQTNANNDLQGKIFNIIIRTDCTPTTMIHSANKILPSTTDGSFEDASADITSVYTSILNLEDSVTSGSTSCSTKDLLHIRIVGFLIVLLHQQRHILGPTWVEQVTNQIMNRQQGGEDLLSVICELGNHYLNYLLRPCMSSSSHCM